MCTRPIECLEEFDVLDEWFDAGFMCSIVVAEGEQEMSKRMGDNRARRAKLTLRSLGLNEFEVK